MSDGNGGVWLTGYSWGNLPVTADALQPALAGSAGSNDAFVMHLGADGTRLYATYLGGTRGEVGSGIARDPAGNIYVVGHTTSFDFPATTGSLQPAAPGGPGGLNGFVVKLDPTGRHIVYATYLGGSSGDGASAVAVDATGSASVVGWTQGSGFPTTWGRCLSYTTSQQSSFYTRLSADGRTAVFSTCLDDSTATGVTLDANGDAWVVGGAGAQFGPRMGFYIGSAPNGGNGFLTKFTPNASNPIPISMYVGGDVSDTASAVAVTSKGVYVAGNGYSHNYPGGATRPPEPHTATLEDGRQITYEGSTAWVMKVALDGTQVLGTTLINGDGDQDRALALQVDSLEVVHVTGDTNSTDFPTSADAPQRTPAGSVDVWYAQAWMPNNVVGDPSFMTYLGGSNIDRGQALAFDGNGGVWIGGDTNSTNFPSVNAKTTPAAPTFIARYGQPAQPPSGGSGSDVVLYAKDASAIVGSWQPVADSTAAGSTRLWNPDAGAGKITAPAASPANYFELTFQANAGVPYHLWLRMKADGDSWQNDSVWVQFSDSVDGSGHPAWRSGTTSGTVVSLEDCSECGEHGWGWNDNGYGVVGQAVVFETTGVHTIRIQQREDGISIDQIVLSSSTWSSTPPGAGKDDSTILDMPPPPASSDEIVIYAGDVDATHGTWQLVSDSSAAGGRRLWNPDAAVAKLTIAESAPSNYVDLTFNARAGVPYHLWLRMRADADSWQNDSVFVQFSDSVDGSGAEVWRIGSTSATIVSLEDCSGCGEQAWGWNDNGYGNPGVLVTFATSGPHTLRVQQREDGISIDQIVLSAATYLSSSPGAAKNDTTLLPK